MCDNSIRYDIKQVQEIILSLGFKCLSRKYKTNNLLLKLKCSKGHIFKRSFRGIRKHPSCPQCTKDNFLLKAKRKAAEHGGKCLSDKYEHSQKKLIWKCGSGHIFKASYSNIVINWGWCPKCANIRLGDRNRKSMGDIHKVEYKTGIKCLSKQYEGNRVKLKWECSSGHIFYRTLNQVATRECPKCNIIAGNKKIIKSNKKTMRDLRAIATQNYGKCLSKTYKNNKEKILWKCCNGHVFKMSYNNVQRGQWCPRCRVGKMQNFLRILLEDILDDQAEVNFRGFTWQYIKKTKRTFEIDIWFKTSKIAVEYDGEHHYRPISYGSKNKDNIEKKYRRRKSLDRLKTRRIRENSKDIKYFIRFSYKESITKDFVRKKLREAGVKC